MLCEKYLQLSHRSSIYHFLLHSIGHNLVLCMVQLHSKRHRKYILTVFPGKRVHWVLCTQINLQQNLTFCLPNMYFFNNFFKFIQLFIYFWVCWVFVSVRGFSLVAASGGYSSSRCVDLSLSRPLLMRSTGSRHAGSVVVAHGLSCSAACGIFPDQGSNPCPLHWQADSQPLHHQGSPQICILLPLSYLECI